MNCPSCNAKMPAPLVVEERAYSVCASCGEDVGVPASEATATTEERIEEFEGEFGFRLPAAYRDLLRKGDGRVLPSIAVAAPENLPQPLEALVGAGGIEIGELAGVDKTDEFNLFENPYLIREWSLPERLLLLSGDGHSWVALDYRRAESEPPVIFIESETNTYCVVAESFKALLEQAR